ncbi:MAG: DUF2156 domain-containing protein [Clostridia bacterium]|nr:DUF2156 domain-containing protein [Clostridia bacterium]
MFSSTVELEFQPVGLRDYSRIYAYTSVCGEGSCQHSPVSMYSLAEKYADEVCEKDGALYTLRARLSDRDYRVYLAPLGLDITKRAYENILADARAYGKKVKFLSLTQKSADKLEHFFPDRFDIAENRDLAEYMYKTALMSSFSGPELQKRRAEVNAFMHRYGDRARVSLIGPEDVAEILAFERLWVEQNAETHDLQALELEERMIKKQLRSFAELHLSGVVLRIDGEVRGFGYGTKLSDTHYDAIVEKGDRSIPHIYKVLRRESVRLCATACEYVNMEEDVGIPGLRALKYLYKPDYLLRKFVAIER